MLMSVLTKFPLTLAELNEYGNGEIEPFEATWEEYLDLLEEAEYNVEFHQNKIHIMSYASDPHETIVINFTSIFFNLFRHEPDMHVRGSNRHVLVEEFKKDYAPDAHLVKGMPIQQTLRKGVTANTNPWLVMEILSPSTRGTDRSEKLPAFKTIPSLRHIVYIEQNRPFVTVYSRVEESERWEKNEYRKLEDSFELDGYPVSLEDIYLKVIFWNWK